MNTKRESIAALGLLGLFSLLFLLAGPAHAQSKKALTNQDVVQMVKAGFDNQTIIKAIQANPTSFDVSPAALLALKNAGVNQTIIQAMLSRTTAEENETSAASRSAANGPSESSPPANPNDPMSPHSPGIYWLSKGGEGNRMLRLEASAYSQTKTGGLFASGMTMGIHKGKIKAVLQGQHSAVRISIANPEFYFYFNQTPQGFGQSNPSSVQVSKPEEFALAKMQTSGKQRTLDVGEIGIGTFGGASSGLSSKETIPVEIQNVAPDIYKVTPKKPLAPGEYCFVPPGGAGGLGTAGGVLFDFGIDKSH